MQAAIEKQKEVYVVSKGILYYTGLVCVIITVGIASFFAICCLKRLPKRMAKRFAKNVLEEEAEAVYVTTATANTPSINITAPSPAPSRKKSPRLGKIYPSIRSLRSVRSTRSGSLPAVNAQGKMWRQKASESAFLSFA